MLLPSVLLFALPLTLAVPKEPTPTVTDGCTCQAFTWRQPKEHGKGKGKGNMPEYPIFQPASYADGNKGWCFRDGAWGGGWYIWDSYALIVPAALYDPAQAASTNPINVTWAKTACTSAGVAGDNVYDFAQACSDWLVAQFVATLTPEDMVDCTGVYMPEGGVRSDCHCGWSCGTSQVDCNGKCEAIGVCNWG